MTAETANPIPTGQRRMRRRGRVVLVGLFAIFLGPIIASLYLNVAKPAWLPVGSVSRGALITPPFKLEPESVAIVGKPGANAGAALSRYWTWAVLSERCETDCESLLTLLARAKIALGRNTQRVRIAVLLTRPAAPEVPAPGGAVYLQLRADAAAGIRAGLAGPEAETMPGEAGNHSQRLLLIDPQSFVIAAYDADSEPEHWLEDIRPLLRISKLDQQF